MVLAASACGFFVSLLYAHLKAPDLAMTQLCVETLSTIMFLVVITKLWNKESVRPERKAVKIRNAVIALCCSAVLFFMLTGAGLMPPFESFSHYFMDKGIELAGGHNIVNMIVVDFRGYDTLGEISVLAIAALAVYNLIQSRVPKKKGDGTAAGTATGAAAGTAAHTSVFESGTTPSGHFIPSCPIPGTSSGGNPTIGYVPCDTAASERDLEERNIDESIQNMNPKEGQSWSR